MADITYRRNLPRDLTPDEVDDNFFNLNEEVSAAASALAGPKFGVGFELVTTSTRVYGGATYRITLPGEGEVLFRAKFSQNDNSQEMGTVLPTANDLEKNSNTGGIYWHEQSPTLRTAVEPWVQGHQRAGQLSWSAGKLWRAKTALVNSLVEPENDPANYEVAGGGTTLTADQVAAIQGASLPSADNPFATLGDTSSIVRVTSNGQVIPSQTAFLGFDGLLGVTQYTSYTYQYSTLPADFTAGKFLITQRGAINLGVGVGGQAGTPINVNNTLDDFDYGFVNIPTPIGSTIYISRNPSRKGPESTYTTFRLPFNKSDFAFDPAFVDKQPRLRKDGTTEVITVWNDGTNVWKLREDGLGLVGTGTTYTDEQAQDAIWNALNHPNHQYIDVTYLDDTGRIKLSVIGIPPFTWEDAQDAAAAALTAGTHTGISFAYDDVAGKINATVTGGGSSYTDEQAQDAAAAMLVAGTHTGATVAYDDANNKLNITVTGGGGGGTWGSITGPITAQTDLNTALNDRFRYRGAFAASTAYAKNDAVLQGGAMYFAPVAFTSGASFNAGNWQSFATTYTRLTFYFAAGTSSEQSIPIAFIDQTGIYNVETTSNVTNLQYKRQPASGSSYISPNINSEQFYLGDSVVVGGTAAVGTAGYVVLRKV
ncbi:hypothetical protein [Hymenobacter tenuis]